MNEPANKQTHVITIIIIIIIISKHPANKHLTVLTVCKLTFFLRTYLLIYRNSKDGIGY